MPHAISGHPDSPQSVRISLSHIWLPRVSSTLPPAVYRGPRAVVRINLISIIPDPTHKLAATHNHSPPLNPKLPGMGSDFHTTGWALGFAMAYKRVLIYHPDK